MKILITGGTGFIGSRVAQALEKEGHDIVVLTRSPEKVKLPFRCRFYQWDATKDTPPPKEALDSVGAVINLIGEGIADKRWSKERKKVLWNSRVKATERLVRSLENVNGLKLFVSASAIGFYGDRGDELLDEQSSKGDGFLSQLCQGWEDAAYKILEKHPGVRLVHTRLGVVLGEKGFLEKLLPIFKMNLGSQLGSGKQYLSWIHINDVVGGFLKVVKEEKFVGALNFVAPEPVTNKELTEELAQALNKRVFLPVPAFAVKTLFGELSEALLGSQRVSSTKLQKSDFEFGTIRAALKNLVSTS